MTGTAAYIISKLEQELETLPGRKNEITQHLVELGYIPLPKVNALRKTDLKNAKDQFLNEVSTSGLFSPEYLKTLSLMGHEVMLATLLRRITDIDEGIVIDHLPQQGEINLVSRLVHYRLDLFGLWPADVASAFSGLSMAGLNEIGSFGKCSALEALNHLADIEAFTRHLLQKHPEEKFILIFRSPQVTNDLKKKLDRRRAFKRQLIDDFGERSDFFRYLSSEVLKNNPSRVDFSFLQREAIDPFKKFVMRLIQVHQWQDGFYSGLLDSDIGDVTLNSFLAAIEFYNKSDSKDIKTHRVITYAHHNYFIFNSLFFLQEYMIEDDDGAESGSDVVLNQLSSKLAQADDQGRAQFSENINRLKNDIFNESEKQPEERKGFLQRIYFGIKKLLKKVTRFAAKIYTWVKDKVEKVWGILKTLFRNFFENLQTGIRAFVDGIRFLFGNSAIETSVDGRFIVSKFSIDGDSVSITSGNITEVLQEHFGNIGYNISSMKFTLSIVAGILKLIINMISIISWPLLLFNIIKIYKSISESYQEIKLSTN